MFIAVILWAFGFACVSAYFAVKGHQLLEVIPVEVRKREALVNGKWHLAGMLVSLVVALSNFVSRAAPYFEVVKGLSSIALVVLAIGYALAAFRVMGRNPSEASLREYARWSGCSAGVAAVGLIILLAGERVVFH